MSCTFKISYHSTKHQLPYKEAYTFHLQAALGLNPLFKVQLPNYNGAPLPILYWILYDYCEDMILVVPRITFF